MPPAPAQVALVPAHGAEVARVVLLPDGTGYLKNDGLAPARRRRTRTSCGRVTGTADEAGRDLGRRARRRPAARPRSDATGPVHGFAITVERAPGVAQPSQAPFASATLT